MRALMATSWGPEGGFSGGKWKTQLVLLMVLVIGASVECSQKADGSEQSERGLMVVTHTSGETRQKRAVPTVGEYFERRVRPRIDSGVGLVKHYVVPALVETALNMGNAGVTAVTQLHRGAKPAAAESAAHIHHVVTEHLAPAFSAASRTLTDATVDSTDRVAEVMLGHERHHRVHETIDAFGTLAKFVSGSNATEAEERGLDTAYNDYGALHPPLYPPTIPEYYDYGAQEYQQEYQEEGSVYYDYPYLPEQQQQQQYAEEPVHVHEHDHDHGHWSQPELNYLSNDYSSGWAEGRNLDAENPDRQGSGEQTVEEALYVIGKNILGRNVTNRLLPVAAQLTRGLGLVGHGFNTIGGAVMGEKKRSSDTGRQGSLQASAPTCSTPTGGSGHCRDIQDCPLLLADLVQLRGSICFKSLFVPGVCCPDDPFAVLQPQQGQQQGQQGVEAPVQALPPPPPPPSLPSIADLPPVDLGPDFVPAETIQHNLVPGTAAACGAVRVPQGRIVGGNETYEGEVPWMSAIYLHGGGRREFWCGGALITERHVITAAHCTKDKNKKSFLPSQFTVRVGEWDLSDQDNYSVELPVTSIVAHPNFRPNGFYNDVAIFTLKQPVQFSQYIQPICLPTGRYSKEDFTHTLPLALGWGTTYYDGEEVPILRGVPLPVWTNRDCDAAYFQPITEVFLCAGYADGGRDACQGDSGGPLMLYDESVSSWLLIGIVSFGNRCAEAGYPGVYTRLTHFIDWIVANIT